ncbi:MAG TPA: hypothetical protein VHM19_23225 [Polyangiales bacterium]|jgi:hypothetical protein|nr:hypothetical protein [Polyangiales bacterium]
MNKTAHRVLARDVDRFNQALARVRRFAEARGWWVAYAVEREATEIVAYHPNDLSSAPYRLRVVVVHP